jgi:hypothetical protein
VELKLKKRDNNPFFMTLEGGGCLHTRCAFLKEAFGGLSEGGVCSREAWSSAGCTKLKSLPSEGEFRVKGQWKEGTARKI